MRKTFHEYGSSGIRTCAVGFGSVKLAMKKNSPARSHAAPPGNSWQLMASQGEFIKFYQTFVS